MDVVYVATWVLCTYTVVYVLYHVGYEGAWYPLRRAMDGGLDPPFSHRVLFVLLANAVHAVLPSFNYPRCYFISQIVAVAATIWLIRVWAGLIVPRFAIWSMLLLVVLLAPTFTYWTFYDIGIVLFVTACLIALVKRRYGAYLVLFALGTLNHEITLTLVPVSIALKYRTWHIGPRGMAWAAAQLTIYALVRLVLFQLIPVSAAWQSGKLQYNMSLILGDPGQLVKTGIVGLAVLSVILARWAHQPFAVKAGLLLVPQLVVITLCFGQLNELRQFDAALPVIVVAMLRAFQSLVARSDDPSGWRGRPPRHRGILRPQGSGANETGSTPNGVG